MKKLSLIAISLLLSVSLFCYADEEAAEPAGPYIPVQEGMRFVGGGEGEDEYMLPLFGTHAPYLFADDNSLLYPDYDLTYLEFSRAIQALIPADSAVQNVDISASDERITRHEIYDVLRTFYTGEELSVLDDSENTISRGEFAQIMNILLGRNGEQIELTEESIMTVDARYDSNLKEASVIHNVSESGSTWEEQRVPVAWHQYEDYLETVYVDPTEKGTVESEMLQGAYNMMTYLPYGYDPQKQYNVLLYIGGGDGEPEYVLGPADRYGHKNAVLDARITTKDYLDYLIQYGYCDPLIVVTVNGSQAAHNAQFRYTELLLHTVQNYSTYATSPDFDGIVAAREHFACAGYSNGGMSTCVTVQIFPDMFAYLGFFSGKYQVEATLQALSEKGPLRYVVTNSGGWRDDNMLGIQNFTEQLRGLSNIEELEYICVEPYGHEGSSFEAGLRALLMRFVPNTRKITQNPAIQ